MEVENRMREKYGYGWIIFIIIIAIATFLMIALFYPRSSPVMSMKISINPQNFKTSQEAILKMSLENHDEERAHSIRLRLITHELVHIFIGSNELTKENVNSGNYTYSFDMQPGQGITQPFVVKVTALPIGIAEQTFSITVEVFIDRGIEKSMLQEVRFKVEKP